MSTAKLVVIALVCAVVSGLVAFIVSSNPRGTAGNTSETNGLRSELANITDMLNRLDMRLEALESRPEAVPEKIAAVLEKRIHNTEKEMAEIKRTVRDANSDVRDANSEKMPPASGAMTEGGADNKRIAEEVIAEIEKNPKRIMDSMRKQMLKKMHNPMDALASLELDTEQSKQAQKILNESIEKYVDINNKRDKMTREEFQEEKRKLTEARKEAFRRILNPVQFEKYEEMEKSMEEMERRPGGMMGRPGSDSSEGMNGSGSSGGR